MLTLLVSAGGHRDVGLNIALCSASLDHLRKCIYQTSEANAEEPDTVELVQVLYPIFRLLV